MNKTLSSWTPFRPEPEDVDAVAEDVSEIRHIQDTLLANSPGLGLADRVAHQYQIAGGKVVLEVAAQLPAELLGVGLFHPGAKHSGIGRISTGLGAPHVETNPDFLGAMAAFQTAEGQRVDFLAINHPAAPADDHREFMDVLHAAGESAGAEIPFIGDWGEYDLGKLFAEQKEFGKALVGRRGFIKGVKTLKHIGGQTLNTFRSSTAYQTYWTGIVEAGGTAGKFTLVPIRDDNEHPSFRPGERHLSDEWRKRQGEGDVEFHLYWISYLDEERTSTTELTEPWEEEHKERVGKLVFPRADPGSEEAKLWAILAAEMGANPGNWIRDKENTIAEPATEFGLARKLAYRMSQKGRGALEPQRYRQVFSAGRIGPELAAELKRRRDDKEKAGQTSWAPDH